MKKKNIIAILLILIILTSEFCLINFGAFGSTSIAVESTKTTEATNYFGNQLTKDMKKFYDVMMDMYNSKKFAKGESSADLVKSDLVPNGIITRAEVEAYTNGSQELLNNVMAARDAFQYDVPDAFYIDFSALSLRVTLDEEDNYHAYIGAGRRDDYFLPGFKAGEEGNIEGENGAIKEYNDALEAAVDEVIENVIKAEKITANAEKASRRTVLKTATGRTAEDAETLTRAAHNWVTEHMNYKYEYQVTEYPTNSGTQKPGVISKSNARTAYDCLIYGEGVCEAYTRGFKAILDELGIPCVCVYGIYQEGTTGGEHIWNYVKIGDEWYAVDTTMDDPSGYANAKSEKENQQYCLVGQLALNVRHKAIGTLSASGYEFTYPEIPIDVFSLGAKSYVNGGFKARVEKDSHEGAKTTSVKISYNGLNYTENAKQGNYILFRTKYDRTEDPIDDKGWDDEWAYLIGGEGFGTIESNRYIDTELGLYLYFPMPQYQGIQFAVTDIPLDPEALEKADIIYHGDEALLKDVTEKFYNNEKIYKAPPYVKTTTPIQTYKLAFGNTYNVKIEFTDALVPQSSGAGMIDRDIPEYEMNGWGHSEKVYDKNGNSAGQLDLVAWGLKSTGAKQSKKGSAKDATYKITSVDLGEFDDKTQEVIRPASISFTFKPDDNFAGGETCYNFYWNGVVGAYSGKQPLSPEWVVGSKAYFCSISIANGGAAMVFGQPELLDTDLSDITIPGDLTDIDPKLRGKKLSEISHRLSLVTTATSDVIDGEMNDMLKKSGLDGVEDISDVKTYNIALMACGCALARINGVKLEVCIGFPEGTTYEDFIKGGLRYKAYHYIHDENGEITGVEEIDVAVVRQGLILYMDAFSPFAIATLKGGSEVTGKQVILSNTEGGKVTFASGTTVSNTGTAAVTENQPVTIWVAADKGKTIDNIAIGGITIDPADTTRITNRPKTNLQEEAIEFKVYASDLEEFGTSRVVVSFASKEVVKEQGKSAAVSIPMIEELRTLSRNLIVNNITTKINMNVFNMSIDSFKKELGTNYPIKVYKNENSNSEITDTTKLIGTGYKMKVLYYTTETENKTNPEYSIVVYGDINGDGKLNSIDIMTWRKWRLNEWGNGFEGLTGLQYEACDFNGDGLYNSLDLMDMRITRLEADKD